jgi:hypothetical protein
MVLLQGLRGKLVAELCTEPRISPSLYYQWRDRFLAKAAKAFAGQQRGQKEARLARENGRLKTLVGELTLELKTSDGVPG